MTGGARRARLGAALAGAGAVAICLAGAGLVVRRRTRAAERLDPPPGRLMTVDGVRLHYLDSGGPGPAVVLLHGNGGMAVEMDVSGLLDRAAERYRVLAFDRPGYGYSDRPRRRAWDAAAQASLLGAALDRLGIERPVVLGHSWGTLVALAMALDRPGRIAGLVLVAGYHCPSRLEMLGRLLPRRLPVAGPLLSRTLLPLAGAVLAPRLARWIFAPQAVPARFKARFPLGLALRPVSLAASVQEVMLIVPAALRILRRLEELRIPVAIVAGSEDRVVDTRRNAVRLYRELPGSELRVLPGLGHMVHHFAPEEVVAAIERVRQRARLPA